MHRIHSIMLLLACSAVMVFAGCSGNAARVDYNKKLKTAFSQLEKGDPERAAENLEQARQIAQENGYDQTEVDRLNVEANMGIGNNVDAYAQAKALLDANPEDPFANELMGKILLKEGQYSQAEKHFITAQEAYESKIDLARAADLLAMSRYFAAYEHGNPRLAESYLHEIKDADLQHALDKARKDVVAKGY